MNPGQKVVVRSSANSAIPVVKFTAQWDIAYDVITFKVDGEPYCDVLIDRRTNLLTYPDVNPSFKDDNLKFLGWSLPEGSWL